MVDIQTQKWSQRGQTIGHKCVSLLTEVLGAIAQVI